MRTVTIGKISTRELMNNAPHVETAEELIEWIRDARQRTFDLVADLSDEQMIGPKDPTINPLLWEIGHAAWFQEKRVLREVGGLKPIRDDVDELYDSIAIEHDVRWDLNLLSRNDIYAYLNEVRDRCIDVVSATPSIKKIRNIVKLAVFHEDMHTEAFTYTRQTLGYPYPSFSNGFEQADYRGNGVNGPLGDTDLPGGRFLFGAKRDGAFAFDNEYEAHGVLIEPFAIARAAVTQGEFCRFVDDDGYARRELWCDEGWMWREKVKADKPLYWSKEANGTWQRRVFDRWLPLESNLPMMHVNWYESQAYCRWSKRRLPTEVEWEVAAAASNSGDGLGLSCEKRRLPWGNAQPDSRHANLDWRSKGTVGVGELPDGDSAFGCRQMIGNVWEWTDSTFVPFPGFEPGPYREYSTTSFDDCKVLRGGCWTTRSRMMWNTWRNFHRPDRRDVWNGFRTCAIDNV